MLGPLLGRGRIATRRPAKCRVEMVFRQLYLRRHGTMEGERFGRRRGGRWGVGGVKARLQFADPIAGRGDNQTGITIQMLLEAALVELRIIEGGEVRCQSTERPDQSVLRGNDVADETEPHLLHEFERALDLVLDVSERIPGGEKIGIQVVAAIGRISKVPGALRRVESSPQEDAAGRQVLRPVRDMDGEDQVDAGAKAIKPALFDEIQAKPAEAVSRLVVSNVTAEHTPHPHTTHTTSAPVHL